MSQALIVVGNFYTHITDMLLEGACIVLDHAGWQYHIKNVPGALEIPTVIRRAITNKNYQAYIALGCIIRGETSHYNYVCTESTRGLMYLSVTYGLAIGYGILTVDNEQQALIRAAPNNGNRGKYAAEAALAVATIFPFEYQ